MLVLDLVLVSSLIRRCKSAQVVRPASWGKSRYMDDLKTSNIVLGDGRSLKVAEGQERESGTSSTVIASPGERKR